MGDGTLFVLGINVGLGLAIAAMLWADPELLAAIIRELLNDGR